MTDETAPETGHDRDSAPPFPARRTQARETRGRWPGVVWAVPIAALLVVLYLGFGAITNHGVDVVVTFDEAAAAKPGDTQVVYKGLTVGRVTKVALARDRKHVDMTLRLDPSTKPLLRKTARFWLIGAAGGLDLSSLKAAVAGISIGMAPGEGPPARRFVGLQKPPVVLPDAAGSSFTLNTDTVGNIRPGASVFYHGLEVGKVTDLDLVDPQRFRMTIFVLSPYDRFVRPGTLFYQASAVQFSLSSAGISTQIAPANAAIAGGVEFDTTADVMAQPHSRPGDVFQLYLDKGHAQSAPKGDQVYYDVLFTDPVGDLDVGSPVRLRGFQIGVVSARSMKFDAERGILLTPVTLAIEPERLGLVDGSKPKGGDWRPKTDAAIGRLIHMGYRARLGQNPPIVGARVVDLALAPDRSLAKGLVPGQTYPLIPAASSGDLAALTSKVDDILSQVQQIPITQIGQDVKRITANLQAITGSPKVTESIDHLNSTLAQVDAMVKEVKPKVGPLVDKLNTAADQASATAASANAVLSGDGSGQDASLPAAIRELTDTSRTIRSLADYLGRHPEALIRGKTGAK